MKGAVLVTGGAGYIGSHVAKALDEAGYEVIVYDDLRSGSREAVQWGRLVEGDVRDERLLAEVMAYHRVHSVVHLAGLIEVGRSFAVPCTFWSVNVDGTASVLAAMRRADVGRLAFSSSAAVYGPCAERLIQEDAPKSPASPYGRTKLACEWLIEAHCRSGEISAVALRYFNAAGADESGRIGETHDPETHLIPLAIKASLGMDPLTVFGTDFETPDGSCLRDFVHVTDLAEAHVAAIEVPLARGTFEAVNLGAGEGRSVLEVIEAISRRTGSPVSYEESARRPGDPAALVANISKAFALLGWKPRLSTLDRVVTDALRWERSGRKVGGFDKLTAGQQGASDAKPTLTK